MAQVDLTFTVIRPDGGDRKSSEGREQGEQNAVIGIKASYTTTFQNIRIGEFSLAETRLMLGSSNAAYIQIASWCSSPTYDETPMQTSTSMSLADFTSWIKSYPNHLFSGVFPTT